MNNSDKTNDLLRSIVKLASSEKKKSGFLIGNTTKIDKEGLFFTPLRNTSHMVIGGVIVFSENQAIEITEVVDGKVDYVLVDAEKKVADVNSISGESSNIERAVREIVIKSKLWVYKGNDLSVEAVDTLLGYLFKDSLKGIGGKRIAIIGGGNFGSKLALKLVERAANVFLTRRDKGKLKTIVDAINLIKPRYTYAKVNCTKDNLLAANKAEALIGTTNGKAIITQEMVQSLAKNAIIIDAGKGTLTLEALKIAAKRSIPIYRLDITAALAGMIETQLTMEENIEKKMGRREFQSESIVAGGIFGREDEFVVDNITNPKLVYGIANGIGDFIRDLSPNQIERLKKMEEYISNH